MKIKHHYRARPFAVLRFPDQDSRTIIASLFGETIAGIPIYTVMSHHLSKADATATLRDLATEFHAKWVGVCGRCHTAHRIRNHQGASRLVVHESPDGSTCKGGWEEVPLDRNRL